MRDPAPVRAALLVIVATAAGIPVVSGPARSQEAVDQGAIPIEAFLEPGRVAELAGRFGPERLEALRRRADERGSPAAWYDLGAALLLRGDLEGATEPLRRATTAPDPAISGSALYDLGLVAALEGRPGAPPEEAEGESDVEVRRRALLRARDHFRQVLRARPDHEDARWNLEVVERWLASETPRSAAGGGGDEGGRGGGGEEPRPALSAEEARSLLEQAAQLESEVQARRLERNRSRDPEVRRDW
jgi:hypothetical protein